MWRRLLSSNLETLAAARSTPIHTRSLISPYASASLFNLRHFTADSADGAAKKRADGAAKKRAEELEKRRAEELEKREAERQARKQRIEFWDRQLEAFNKAVAPAVKRHAEAAQKAAELREQEIKRELENTTTEEEGDNFFHFLRPDFLYNFNGDEVDERVEDENDMPIVNYPGYDFGTKEEPAIIDSFYDKRIAGCFGGESRLKHSHDFVCFWLEKGKPRKCPVCPQYFELKVVGPGGLPDGQRRR